MSTTRTHPSFLFSALDSKIWYSVIMAVSCKCTYTHTRAHAHTRNREILGKPFVNASIPNSEWYFCLFPFPWIPGGASLHHGNLSILKNKYKQLSQLISKLLNMEKHFLILGMRFVGYHHACCFVPVHICDPLKHERIFDFERVPVIPKNSWVHSLCQWLHLLPVYLIHLHSFW